MVNLPFIIQKWYPYHSEQFKKNRLLHFSVAGTLSYLFLLWFRSLPKKGFVSLFLEMFGITRM